MKTDRRTRWRDTRDTLPARRRRRQHRRRDVPRGGDYTPVVIEADVACRGVNTRLALGAFAMFLTFGCLATFILVPQMKFATLGLFSVGFCSFNAGLALILGARREEQMHRLGLEELAGMITGPDGADGSVELEVPGYLDALGEHAVVRRPDADTRARPSGDASCEPDAAPRLPLPPRRKLLL